jgi:hypothetical protein
MKLKTGTEIKIAHLQMMWQTLSKAYTTNYELFVVFMDTCKKKDLKISDEYVAQFHAANLSNRHDPSFLGKAYVPSLLREIANEYVTCDSNGKYLLESPDWPKLQMKDLATSPNILLQDLFPVAARPLETKPAAVSNFSLGK